MSSLEYIEFMEKKRIGDLVSLFSGYAFRGAVKNTDSGSMLVIQAKDIDPDNYIFNEEALTKIDQEIPRSNSYLQKNDVLLVSRGSGAGSFRTSVFKLENENTVASSTLYILRVKTNELIPEYLSLYLNSREGQGLLSFIASGSYIKSLNRAPLEGLEIPLPNMERQKLLVALFKNVKDQERLLDRKNSIINNLLSTSIKNVTC